ncbi:MAG: hypothetical protein GY799_25275 [Desulfobulbaceae bacterium]|nr:hypothetical protein [Desulfobulbaceae bacterium]
MSKIEKAAALAEQLRTAALDARTEMTRSESLLFEATLKKIAKTSTTLNALASIHNEPE